MDKAATTEEVKRVKKGIQEAYGLTKERRSVVNEFIDKWTSNPGPCNPAGVDLKALGGNLLSGTGLSGVELEAMAARGGIYKPLGAALAAREIGKNWAAVGFDDEGFYQRNVVLAVNYTPPKGGGEGRDELYALKKNLAEVAKFDGCNVAKLTPTRVLKINRARSKYEEAKVREKDARARGNKKGGGKSGRSP